MAKVIVMKAMAIWRRESEENVINENNQLKKHESAITEKKENIMAAAAQ
jgi:hypothetical protein